MNKFGNLFLDVNEMGKSEQVIDLIDNLNNDDEYEPARSIAFSPSQVGRCQDCARKLIFSYWNRPGRLVYADLQRIFDNGKAVHTRIQRYLHRLSSNPANNLKLLGQWECKLCGRFFEGVEEQPKVCGRYDGATRVCASSQFIYREVSLEHTALKIKGHCDGLIVWRRKKWLIEIKSMNQFQFQKLTEIPEYYLVQAHMYMRLAKVHRMIFLVECKGTQRLTEIHVTYSREVIDHVLRQIKIAGGHIDKGTMPERLTTAACKKCDYSYICAKEA